MTEAVGLLLSPLLQVIFEKIASPEFVEFFRSRKLDSRLLKRLEIVLLSANAVLEDAEEMQFTRPVVKKWLDELKDAVYDAEDILDEIHTRVLQCKLDAECQTVATKVRKIISTFNPFVKKIEPKIKDVLETLDDLVKQKDVIGLKEGVGGKSSRSRSSTTSLVKESDIFGRTDDKEAIINLLLSDNISGNELCVIAIVGMGGVGKTTLAQLVYNDNRMEGHFDFKVWVCVSDEFDVLKMTKIILGELGLSTNSESNNLDRLQVTLQQNLTGKRFLIVLDDVWNKNYSEWEALSNPFKSGAEGSRIIVTSRERRAASIMHPTEIYDLKTLQDDDCWSLFSKHAFHSGNSDAHPELEVIGRQIVKRCDGLPLAVKTIGALLWSELDVNEWNKILRSEIWDLPSEVIPALRLSYKYLPLHLKRCFAYCAIVPKDYDFEKEELILLWMAEGFLPQGKDRTMEEIGDDYFADLVSRSLFQQSSGYALKFIMHDLVNDLARLVSGQFTLTLEVENSSENVNKTRHLLLLTDSRRNIEMFEALYDVLYKAKGLRTLLIINSYNIRIDKLMHDLQPILRFVRVLNLSNSEYLTELPDSIGKLKHLRHLDVSQSSIRKLPDSICKLCNLLTLKISLCGDLTELPRDSHKLINLRHLDFSDTPIKEMPVHLGRLCCLQTLTQFIVSKQSGAGIGELGKLANLGGKLLISDLQNVVSPTGAVVASLHDKMYLKELGLEWNDDNNISESQRVVLDNLQPHVNLKWLSIIGYGGKSFPDWIGHHSFSNIVSLCLFKCKHCSVLPPLGQLPSLQSLCIDQFDGIDAVGREFYGNCSSSTKPFGALKVLKFRDMPKLKKWFAFSAENEGGVFTYLEQLEIVNCPKLAGELPIHPCSLSRLVIVRCPLLVTSLPSAATLRQLMLRDCNEFLIFTEFPTELQKLEIGGFDGLESIPERLVDFNSCLEELKISDCHSLTSLSSAGLPSTLKILEIHDCSKLELPMHQNYSSLETLSSHDSFDSLKSFPLNLFPNLTSINLVRCLNLESFNVPQQVELDFVALSSMQIKNCPNFVSFPNGGLSAPKLDSFVVTNCRSLTSLPDKMHILLPSLWGLHLENCPEVESFPEGGLPSKLGKISIIDCDKLIANRRDWGFQDLSSIRYITVHGNCKDVESFPEVGLLPTNLVSLEIGKFPNMKSLDHEALRLLTSLDELLLYSCPKLKFMQEEGLPVSISTLHIFVCALLEKQLESRKAWSKIDHIPLIYINGELI